MSEEIQNLAGAGTPSASPKKKLGFSKDVEGKSGIPIPAPHKLNTRTDIYPNGYSFPIGKLVNVVFNAEKEVNRNGVTDTTPALTFVFRTADGKQFTHVEWPIEDNDDKFQDKYDRLQRRLRHIFDETIGANKFEEFEADDFKEFFEIMGNQFNKHTYVVGEGENAKTLKHYANTSIYIKVTYNGTRLQFPLYPNFVQRAGTKEKMIPCDLLITPQYDKIEPVEAKRATPFSTGTDNTYGGGTSTFAEDFPDI